MTTTISNLPRDLVEEVISRVPATSMRKVRSTCKKWNTLSKDRSFTAKHLAKAAAASTEKKESLAIVLMNYSLHLMSVNLHNNNPPLSPEGKLIHQLEVTRVCHCEGLLLCTTRDYTSLVVWNPYSGQTRWISVEPAYPTYLAHRLHLYGHVLGYNEGKRSHKILRFAYAPSNLEQSVQEIYDLSTDSWRVLDDDPDWCLEYGNYGLSLKGNSYWYAMDKESRGQGVPDFLLCFDFTNERFAPRLPLPFTSWCPDSVSLSSVRGEQLVVLFQSSDMLDLEIWVTTEIGPEAVSWSKLLTLDTGGPLRGLEFGSGGGFFVDEEKRAVIVFDEEKHVKTRPTRHVARIFGEVGYSLREEVDLGEVTKDDGFSLLHACSYVPSAVLF
ncbi:unnamed protein product [Microthlaspi erraticum]|uniref:F-box domain-containing protein n=1 Tax=Microthlaspi erraticum TaxID=1685480 RepID=A0A6D2I753_9BRAS|nr:unnamed protein product [Microthlaspi erraticum]